MAYPSDPADLTLTEVAAAVGAGELDPDESRRACRRRLDAREGELAAWAAVDLGEPPPPPAGPLQGVVVGVKDVIDVAGLPTRAGSRSYEAWPAEDAPAVGRLRRAGAVIGGKTACTEFATNDPAPTRNPWDPARTPGGSSPGSAVAVATGMCHATLDTQTAGDILRPAAFNGVVGFKPGYDRIPREGSVAVAWSIDTLGVQARRVEDVARLWRALVGEDRAPGRTAPPPTFGIVRDPLLEGCEPEVADGLRRVRGELAAAGATVRDVRPPVELQVAVAAHRIVTFVECAALHEQRYRDAAADLGPKLRTLLELGQVTPAAGYVRAQRVRGRVIAGLRTLVEDVDALLLPVVPGAAPRERSTTGDPTFQIPWTFAGLPALSLPTALDGAGLPRAVQLVGRPQREDRLLRAAGWCESVLTR